MPKFIEDEMRRQYKKNYAELLAKINPKPSLAERERRIQEHLNRRGNK